MKKTAIILGATGLTGGLLLERLLADDDYRTIKLFSRSSVKKSNPKIEEHITDLLALEKEAQHFRGEVVFCCIGTTKSKTSNKEKYKEIDYGIPVTAAGLAAQNGIGAFLVISAMGADPKSTVFYNKVKGEMEQDVIAQQVPHTYIFQPSLIGGKREEKRFGESAAKFFMSVFGFLVPKKYKIIAPETIAKAMQIVAAKGYHQARIPSEEIKKIAGS